MNILVFTTAFYPSIGGLENQTIYLLDEFVKAGHNIRVITFQSTLSAKFKNNSKHPPFSTYYNPNFIKVVLLFLWSDVFYMPNFSLKGTWLLPFMPFKKWVISHNDLYLSNTKSFKTKLKLLCIKLASRNIAVSKCVAGYLNTDSKIIYNCYDNDVFKRYNDEIRQYEFVFLGRLVSQKGCTILIDACRHLQAEYTLNIIGDGPEKQHLEKKVVDFGLENKINFLGILEGEELARTLNRHHCMIIPSVSEEGFGIVALEGMACGCKIIAADAGGLTEAVREFGKLFKMGSVESLHKTLQMELGEINKNDTGHKSTELDNYLLGQNKQAVARQYLHLFTQAS